MEKILSYHKKTIYSLNKFFTLLLPFFVCLFLLFGCGKGNEFGSAGDFASVDTSLIGIEISDSNLGVKFNPPKNWELTSTLASKKVLGLGGKGSKEKGRFIFLPAYIFFNHETDQLLNVGTVVFDDSGKTFAADFELYKSTLSRSLNPNIKSMANFVKDGLHFTYFKGEQQNFVWIKIICQNLKGSTVQFDYNSTKDNFAAQEKAIKSSIATIQLVN